MRQGFDGQKLRPHACLEESKRELRAAVSAGPEVKGEKSALRDAGRCRGVRDPDAWSRMPWGDGGDDAGGRMERARESRNVTPLPGDAVAVVSVPVWRSESQMTKVLKKFCFRTGISKKA